MAGLCPAWKSSLPSRGPDPLRRRARGEIWGRGSQRGAGYWNRSQETAEVFAAHIAGSHQGPFLRTRAIWGFCGKVSCL